MNFINFQTRIKFKNLEHHYLYTVSQNNVTLLTFVIVRFHPTLLIFGANIPEKINNKIPIHSQLNTRGFVFELYLVKLATIFIATALATLWCIWSTRHYSSLAQTCGQRTVPTWIQWTTRSLTVVMQLGASPRCTPILDVADLKQHLIGWLEFAGLENDGLHQYGLTLRCLE